MILPSYMLCSFLKSSLEFPGAQTGTFYRLSGEPCTLLDSAVVVLDRNSLLALGKLGTSLPNLVWSLFSPPQGRRHHHWEGLYH